MIGHLLSFLVGHGSVVLEIHLVADENPSDVVLRVLFDLVHPGVHAVERVSICDVVNHDDTVSALVVRGGDGLESLLTSCVPNLQLAHFVVRLESPDLEINTDCWHEIVVELVVRESEEEARLADSGVSNHENLEEVVAKQAFVVMHATRKLTIPNFALTWLLSFLVYKIIL